MIKYIIDSAERCNKIMIEKKEVDPDGHPDYIGYFTLFKLAGDLESLSMRRQLSGIAIDILEDLSQNPVALQNHSQDKPAYCTWV